MNQKFKQAWSTAQQDKLHQLQLEVAALEKQLENILAPAQLTDRYSSQSPISIISTSDRLTRTGIKLAPDADG